MSDPSWKKQAAGREHDPVNNRDEEVELTGEPEAANSTISSTDADVQKEFAELQLVDALLNCMSQRAVGEREDRIRNVMQAISKPVPTGPSKINLARSITVAAVAASFLIAVALFSIHSARNTLANEVLSAVNKASSVPTDRVYTIQRILASRGDQNLPRGMLYLRGREGLLMTCSDAVLGRNRGQFWLLTEQQHVTVSDSFDWIDAEGTRDQIGVRFLQELSLTSLNVPLMELASVAELMQDDYKVNLSRAWLDGDAVDLLIGERRSSPSELPAKIRLWADANSRIIRRAEFTWEPGNAITLELSSAEPVPADWYSYSAHCNGEPIVHRIPSGS